MANVRDAGSSQYRASEGRQSFQRFSSFKSSTSEDYMPTNIFAAGSHRSLSPPPDYESPRSKLSHTNSSGVPSFSSQSSQRDFGHHQQHAPSSPSTSASHARSGGGRSRKTPDIDTSSSCTPSNMIFSSSSPRGAFPLPQSSAVTSPPSTSSARSGFLGHRHHHFSSSPSAPTGVKSPKSEPSHHSSFPYHAHHGHASPSSSRSGVAYQSNNVSFAEKQPFLSNPEVAASPSSNGAGGFPGPGHANRGLLVQQNTAPATPRASMGVAYQAHSTRKLRTEPMDEASRSLEHEEITYSSDEESSLADDDDDDNEGYPHDAALAGDDFIYGGGGGEGEGENNYPEFSLSASASASHTVPAIGISRNNSWGAGVSEHLLDARVSRGSQRRPRRSSYGSDNRSRKGTLDDIFSVDGVNVFGGEGTSFRAKFEEQRRAAASKKKARDAAIKADLEACNFEFSGWLWKKNPGGLKKLRVWKKRFCCFRPKKIVYFKSRGSSSRSTTIGSIPFADIKRVHRHATKKPIGCRFTIHTSMGNGRAYEFRAPTRQDADRWIENLKRCRHLFSTSESDLPAHIRNSSSRPYAAPPALRATSSPVQGMTTSTPAPADHTSSPSTKHPPATSTESRSSSWRSPPSKPLPPAPHQHHHQQQAASPTSPSPSYTPSSSHQQHHHGQQAASPSSPSYTSTSSHQHHHGQQAASPSSPSYTSTSNHHQHHHQQAASPSSPSYTPASSQPFALPRVVPAQHGLGRRGPTAADAYLSGS